MEGGNEIINDFLYLGDSLLASKSKILLENKITHILCVKDSTIKQPNFVLLHVPLNDYGESDLQSNFDKCFDFISNNIFL
jgi:hypothetical protein